MRPKVTKLYAPLSDPTLSPVKTILRQVSKSSKEVVKIVQTTLKNERKRKMIRRKRLNLDAGPKKMIDPPLASLSTANEDVQKEFPLYCTYEEFISNLNCGDIIEPMEAESLRMMSDSQYNELIGKHGNVFQHQS
ncbi:hypothetical protein J437_LFUL003734 [Ladona fulva]|uniref:Uncharacterized protein n=1 Tax=Ladona fulva TaxID=123851 RepID=A0A8K0NVX5_LADFU|nr:hypothetical protein J437_LFUL003734 [Ladona fulva]